MLAIVALLTTPALFAQPTPDRGRNDRGGPPGGFARAKRELVEKFDSNQDGWLNAEERASARQFLKEQPSEPQFGGRRRGGRRGGGFDPARIFERQDENADGELSREEVEGSPLARDFARVDANGDGALTLDEVNAAMQARMRRGPGRFGGNRPPASPGEKVAVESVEPVRGALYDATLLRTIFIEFENEDWESELEAFHNSDVEVPAKLTVDGRAYPQCGVRFRGQSSYMMVPTGHKRSLNISMDLVADDQRLYGYKTLNLLNGNGDATMMSTVLYSQLASEHLPVPKANFVRVVINGENWGIYTNVQQFNKEFLREHYPSTKGARWKVEGSPRGGGGLDYRGEDPGEYGHPYVLKGGKKESLSKLIELCRTLEEVPAEELEAALQEKVDLDELLWFLAYDNALCNSDGYWTRASDYSIFLDKHDVFHFIPHDMNEAFRPARAGRGGGGRFRPRPDAATDNAMGLDPLIGLTDRDKPLRSKVLAVPALRARYLANVRTIADQLRWDVFGPRVAQLRALIGPELERDTRKLSTSEEFMKLTGDALSPAAPTGGDGAGRRRGGPSTVSLRRFAEGRRAFLLESLGGEPGAGDAPKRDATKPEANDGDDGDENKDEGVDFRRR